MTTTEPTLWDDAEIISRYTRAQAIEDGVLVDISTTKEVDEAGFRFPVAMTIAAYTDVVDWDTDNKATQDITGRLWDVCWMLLCQIRRCESTDRIAFELYRVPNSRNATRPTLVRLIAVCGPGDEGEPVVTIMLPGED